MEESTALTTVLFTDLEGSTRLWEQHGERMRDALAQHDAAGRRCVEGHRGIVVKSTGDGMQAVFDDPCDAIAAAVQFQLELADVAQRCGLGLLARCGVHVGVVHRRDADYFGSPVNRAARIMAAAHGGQVLLSQAVVDMAREHLPADVSLVDLGMVRLRGLSTAEQVHQVVHPRLRREFPALRSLETSPSNLPLPINAFVGRERELREILRLLDHARLLTLLGTGGIGKTRLALQAGAQVLDRHGDGVWFVDLSGLGDARLVPQAVASVLGVKESAERTLLDALTHHVATRSLLIILDNCEHLVESCADIATRLLQAGPDVKVLASSREPLRVTGETTYAVPPLAVPAADDRASPENLASYESVRLFTERARAAQSAFALTRENAQSVVEICRRLDGIPLAIELAAARIRAMSAPQIAARLNDRFRLLTSGDRTALPRQQTLRALIDWSYELLSDTERTLLRRLSAFAGGCTLDAVECVGAGGSVEAIDVLDLLARLVEKSLVTLDTSGERYRMLDTIREYARQRLVEAGEERETAQRHLEYCVRLAERAAPELVGPEQGKWLEELDAERENMLAAHAWCDHATSGAELGFRLSSAMRRYWVNRGLAALGFGVAIEALRRTSAQDRTPTRCRALFDAGQLASFMGRYAEAERYLAESLSIARESRDAMMEAMVLQPLGMAALGQGHLGRARQHLEEALQRVEALGNKRQLAGALNALAQLHRLENRLDAAQPLYEQVVALARELQDQESIAIGLLNLAMVCIDRGEEEGARAMLVEVLAIAERIGSRQSGQSALDVCAGLAASRKAWARAARFFGSAQAQASQTGLYRDPSDEAFLSPRIDAAKQALGTTTFDDAVAAGSTLSYDAAIAEACAWLRDADAAVSSG